MALHLRQTPVRAKRQPGAIQCAVVLFGPQPAGASPFLADVLAVLAADPLPPPQQRLVTDIDPGSALQRGLGRDRGHEERAVIGAEAIDDETQFVVGNSDFSKQSCVAKRAPGGTALFVDFAERAEDLLNGEIVAAEILENFVRVLGQRASDAADRSVMV